MRFPAPAHVSLGEGVFGASADVNRDYVLRWDPDRLLAPFLREAGLPTRADSYGNWESSGLDGHIAGHCLSALSLMAATGDTQARQRLAYMVGELRRAQDALGTGYVGGIPGGRARFEALREGGVEAAEQLGAAGSWVPWYNLHKTFAGLIDAHRHGGVEDALDVVVRLAQWWLGIAAEMTSGAFERMLDTEYGGMNGAFADLALMTGRSEFAEMAKRFAHRRLLEPLGGPAFELAGMHANTEIAKVLGYAKVAVATGDDAHLAAALAFWRDVVAHRTVATAGNSVREHFHARDDFSEMLEDREGPESCNTVNMIELAATLAGLDDDPAYLDYIESALYNGVLASQHPVHGGFVYFTPIRPRHYRVYSRHDQGMWCCVGTGAEAHARYGAYVFGEQDGAVAVNLYHSATLDPSPFGGRVRVETSFPDDPRVAVHIDVVQPTAFALRLRLPVWLDALDDLRVNGAPVAGTHVQSAVVIDRAWSPGDRVTFSIPLAVRAVPLPGDDAWAAAMAGPLLLAAPAGDAHLAGLVADDSRMGHIARGPLVPVADLPIIGSDAVPEASGDGRWRLASVDPPGAIALEPFFRVHDSRYVLYHPVAVSTVAERRAALVASDHATAALDAMTIDRVALGEQQPESDHGFAGDGSALRVAPDGSRSRATAGSMSVTLENPERAARLLRVTYAPTDTATRVRVCVDGVRIADESWDASDAAFSVDYGMPGEFTADAAQGARIRVVIEAPPGATTPFVSEVRLLRWAAPS